jgi:hypothetical protein
MGTNFLFQMLKWIGNLLVIFLNFIDLF